MHDDSIEWQQLNAYADGELPEAAAHRLEVRLAREPDLQRELAQLQDLKRKLALMRPVVTQPAENPRRPAWPRAGKAAAIAASLVAFIAVAVVAATHFMATGATWLEHALALHSEQSRRAYVVDEQYVVQTVSSGHALEFRSPDLTASRLFLVDIATSDWDDRETIAIHYRGLRGCRLSLVAVEANADDDEAPIPAGQADEMQTWSHDGFHFAVIADGMDRARFATIADFVRGTIVAPKVDNGSMRTAMVETQRNARPCA